MYNNYFIKEGQEKVDLTYDADDRSFTSFSSETFLECTVVGFLDGGNEKFGNNGFEH